MPNLRLSCISACMPAGPSEPAGTDDQTGLPHVACVELLPELKSGIGMRLGMLHAAGPEQAAREAARLRLKYLHLGKDFARGFNMALQARPQAAMAWTCRTLVEMSRYPDVFARRAAELIGGHAHLRIDFSKLGTRFHADIATILSRDSIAHLRKVQLTIANAPMQTAITGPDVLAAIASLNARGEASLDIELKIVEAGKSDPTHWAHFVQQLHAMPPSRITVLDLSGGTLSDLHLDPLRMLLTNAHGNIGRLSLESCHIGSAGVRNLESMFENGECGLTSLDLRGNELFAEGAEAVANILRHTNSRLHTLDIGGNRIPNRGAVLLLEALRQDGNRLQRLGIAGNQLVSQADGLNMALSETMAHANCMLEHLDFSRNALGDEGFSAILRGIRERPSPLRSLMVRENGISSAGAKVFADTVAHPNCGLQVVDLAANKIGHSGAKAIALAIRGPQSRVETIDLTKSKIRVFGIFNTKAARLLEGATRANDTLRNVLF